MGINVNKKRISPSTQDESVFKYGEDYFFGKGYFDKKAVDLWIRDKGKTLPPNLKEIFELGNVKARERVLDLGCGFGQIALHCAIKGCKTVAIDSSQASINLARESFRENKVNVTLLKRDCWDLPFGNSSFDVVYLIAVVWHLTEDQLIRTLSEIYRILRPGGRLVTNTCGNPWTETFGFPFLWIYKKTTGRPFFAENEDSGHVSRLNPMAFKKNLENAGFSVTLRIGFNPSEKISTLHNVILKTPSKYFLCKGVQAICTK